jgi:hypothetical protein
MIVSVTGKTFKKCKQTSYVIFWYFGNLVWPKPTKKGKWDEINIIFACFKNVFSEAEFNFLLI